MTAWERITFYMMLVKGLLRWAHNDEHSDYLLVN